MQFWDQNGETVSHITSECPKLAQKQHQERYDKVEKLSTGKCALNVIWAEKIDVNDHEPKRVLENDEVKILLDLVM